MKEYFISTTLLAIVTSIVGLFLAFILHKKSEINFFKSKTFVSIMVWFALYFLFVLFMISNQLFQILVMLYVVYKIRQDILDNISVKKWFETVSFGLVVLIGIVALWMLSTMTVIGTIATLFGATYALASDYIVRKNFKLHKIKFLKNIFSWEVLIARFFASILGVWLVSIFVASVDLFTGLLVFLGSTFGEWLNVVVKKQLDIKKWSDSSFALSGFIDNSCGIGFAALFVLLVQYF